MFGVRCKHMCAFFQICNFSKLKLPKMLCGLTLLNSVAMKRVLGSNGLEKLYLWKKAQEIMTFCTSIVIPFEYLMSKSSSQIFYRVIFPSFQNWFKKGVLTHFSFLIPKTPFWVAPYSELLSDGIKRQKKLSFPFNVPQKE